LKAIRRIGRAARTSFSQPDNPSKVSRLQSAPPVPRVWFSALEVRCSVEKFVTGPHRWRLYFETINPCLKLPFQKSISSEFVKKIVNALKVESSSSSTGKSIGLTLQFKTAHHSMSRWRGHWEKSNI
jgi:hypothetical protein